MFNYQTGVQTEQWFHYLFFWLTVSRVLHFYYQWPYSGNFEFLLRSSQCLTNWFKRGVDGLNARWGDCNELTTIQHTWEMGIIWQAVAYSHLSAQISLSFSASVGRRQVPASCCTYTELTQDFIFVL
jgi:hypothetical protein